MWYAVLAINSAECTNLYMCESHFLSLFYSYDSKISLFYQSTSSTFAQIPFLISFSKSHVLVNSVSPSYQQTLSRLSISALNGDLLPHLKTASKNKEKQNKMLPRIKLHPHPPLPVNKAAFPIQSIADWILPLLQSTTKDLSRTFVYLHLTQPSRNYNKVAH